MRLFTKTTSYIHKISKLLKAVKITLFKPTLKHHINPQHSPTRPLRPASIASIPSRTCSISIAFDPTQPPSPDTSRLQSTRSLYNSSLLAAASDTNNAIQELNRQVSIVKGGGGSLGEVLKARKEVARRLSYLVQEGTGSTWAAGVLVEGLCSSGKSAVEECDCEVLRQRGW